MNERIKELALGAGLLNYVDNETPRWYFIHNHADLEEVQKFAELIIEECARVARATPAPDFHEHLKQQLGHTWDMACSASGNEIVKHFGVEG